jgi:hypothetical protein
MYAEDYQAAAWGGFILLILLIVLVWSLVAIGRARRRAVRAGYKGIFDHLRAVPRNDEEKREAVNMAFRGLAYCLLGIVLTPLLLFGLPPLYYGGRKITLVLLGTDLLADDDAA